MKYLVKAIVLLFYRLLVRFCPIQKNIILFQSNIGRNYTGNPRAIYEEMVKQGLDQKYRCYFILDNTATQIPGRAKKIKNMRVKYFYLFAIAGIWICDSRLPVYIIKREGVTYIQTWHGTPLKKLALDMEEVNMAGEDDIELYKKHFYNNAQTWDYLVSQNQFSTTIFRGCFAFEKTILEIGYPRNDRLFYENNKESIIDLKKKLDLPLDKKVILYAPTWRDNEFYEKGRYKFRPKLNFDILKEGLSKQFVVIVKYHYLIQDNIDWTPYKGFIYDFNLDYEIGELYLVSDYLITDYSSVMFDYSLLKKPILFYVYDLEYYKNNLRGFYFDLVREAPGPISLTTEDLIDDILYYKKEDYEKKYKTFVEKYNHLDDGMASKKVIEVIEKEYTSFLER